MEQSRPNSEREVVRRLPEVATLHGRVQEEVIRIVQERIPEYFWIARASESYHPPDERGLGGLWLHHKRVFMAYTMLEPTFRELGAIDSFEANCARAACVLHDGFKYGVGTDFSDGEDHHPYADGHLSHLHEHTDPEHDVGMASYIRTDTDLPDEVARCIESHGGSTSWGSHDGPSPSDDLELVVHLADVFASNRRHRMPVFKPCEELTIMAGSVPAIEDLEWVEEVNEYV